MKTFYIFPLLNIRVVRIIIIFVIEQKHKIITIQENDSGIKVIQNVAMSQYLSLLFFYFILFYYCRLYNSSRKSFHLLMYHAIYPRLRYRISILPSLRFSRTSIHIPLRRLSASTPTPCLFLRCFHSTAAHYAIVIILPTLLSSHFNCVVWPDHHSYCSLLVH